MNALEQRLSALEAANSVRIAGMQVKDELASLDRVAGYRRAADLLRNWDDLNPRPALSTASFLDAIRRVGPSGVHKFCRAAGVNPVRRVSDLTANQQAILVRLLENDAARLEREQSLRAKGRRYGS